MATRFLRSEQAGWGSDSLSPIPLKTGNWLLTIASRQFPVASSQGANRVMDDFIVRVAAVGDRHGDAFLRLEQP